MTWRTGDLVVHKARPEWGIGKVFNVNSEKLEVFFVDGGKRVLAQPTALLEVTPAELRGNALLAGLTPDVVDSKTKFLPLTQCISYFRKLFPEGFYDPLYLTDPEHSERNYKIAASELAQSLLNEATWSALSSTGNYSEICLRLARIESKTNLLHTFEKIKWHAALKDEQIQEALTKAIYNDLFGKGSRMSRFDELAKVLNVAEGCAKWPIATYYGFLIQPDPRREPRIFVKPEVTKFAAEACGWDLQYESALNW